MSSGVPLMHQSSVAGRGSVGPCANAHCCEAMAAATTREKRFIAVERTHSGATADKSPPATVLLFEILRSPQQLIVRPFVKTARRVNAAVPSSHPPT